MAITNMKRRRVPAVFGLLLWLHLNSCQGQGTTSQPCDPGWFGSDCQYKCHCTNHDCDDNGECTGVSKCEAGWFGPACQYVDLAKTESTWHTPDWLTDAVETTCNPNKQPHSISVRLTSWLPLNWFRLQVNDPDLLQNVSLIFNSWSGSSGISCGNKRTSMVNTRTLDIYCEINGRVERVTLSGKGVISVCSLYISGGRNVALKQIATQSSTYEDSGPQLAVDGITTKDWFNGSCTHTAGGGDDENPNWNLTFSQPQLVTRYKLYNRRDTKPYEYSKYCCPERLKGFHLTSYGKNDTQVFNHQDREWNPQLVYNVMNDALSSPVSRVNIRATYIWTDRNRKISYKILTLCEVKIYGDSACESGRYGRECEHKCNCAKVNEPCFVSTGGCPSGCAIGFQGENCQLSCDPGKYGPECKKECSPFCVNDTMPSMSPCNHINGSCTNGCQDGYEGLLCEQKISVSPDAQTDDGSDGGGASIPAIAGAVVGVVVIIAIIVVVIVCRRRRNSKHGSSPNDTRNNVETNSEDGVRNRGYEEILIGSGEPSAAAGASEASSADNEHPSHMITAAAVPGWRESPEESASSGTPKAKSAPTAPKKPKGLKGFGKQTKAKDNEKSPYYNMVGGKKGTAIAVGDLAAFMRAHKREFFHQQFNSIPANTEATALTGQSEENKSKNRYKNIYAYDHSRVHLKIDKAKKHGDYINANYIEGYQARDKFIASQGPTKAMIEDFVRMLWEQHVGKVVMLTNLVEEGKHKCEMYWPEDGELQIGDIIIKLTVTQVFADYTIRRLELRKEGEGSRELTQFHFTAWPDKDVPTIPWGLVDFEQRVASYPTQQPIVVHCSAGVGRTGTFIALHNVIREAEDKGQVDFFTALQKLRRDRNYMVQTADQYEFLHKATLVAIVCMDTTVTSSGIQARISKLEQKTKGGQKFMEKEFKDVCSLCDEEDEETNDEDGGYVSVYQNSRTLVNKRKNRLSNIMPKEFYRVTLMQENNDVGEYINAVFVPSFRRQNQQILTQLPLPMTVIDLWRLVTQHSVSLLVVFEMDKQGKDSTIGDYLPTREDESLSLPLYDITAGAATLSDVWEERKVVITAKEDQIADYAASFALKGSYRLRHLKYTTNDLDPAKLLKLISQIRSHNAVGKGKTLYMCRNGADYSGLVCVLTLLLDRMDNDHRLTVPLVVGALKAVRPQVVPTLDQYRLLYQSLQLYSEMANVYSNFGDTVISVGGLGASQGNKPYSSNSDV